MRGCAHRLRARRSAAALVLLLAASVFLLAASVAAAAPRTVRVGIYENEPKIFTNAATGKPAGIFVDLLEAIAKDEGWRLVWVPGTWDEDLKALEQGRIDLMPDVAFTPERDKIFDFHKDPVVENWSYIYSAPGVHAERLAELNGKRVAVLQNTIQEIALRQLVDGFGYKIEIVRAESLNDAFELASKRKVDAAVANHLFGDYFYQRYGLQKTPIVLNQVPMFYAVGKGKNADLLDRIDRHLVAWKMQPSSFYYKTFNRYTSTERVSMVPPWLLWAVAIGAAVLVMASALAGLFRWQVALRTRSLRRANEEILRLNADLEARVQERTAELAAANEDLKSFSYSVSHDLRAPLRAVSGFSQILARRHRQDLNEDGQHYLDNIVQASERMGHLIEDLLTYSRLGRKSVDCEPVPAAQVAESLATEFGQRLAESGGLFEVAHDLPIVMGDRTLLAQILTNLLDNAVTYRRAEVPPWVVVDWRGEGDNVVLYVRDNGIGIPEEYQDKIFNVFQRLHSEDEYPGTGIGLANVKKCAEMMGGEVWVESVVGEGSTFYVRLAKER